MKVADYRSLIRSAQDMVFRHFCACVGDKEKIRWFLNAFSVFNELSRAECATAKADDRDDIERAYDRFHTIIQNNESLWMQAKAIQESYKPKTKPITESEFKKLSDELAANLEEISEAVHEIQVYRSSLTHFQKEASEFTVRLWKKRLDQAQERYDNAKRVGDELTKKANLMIGIF